MKIPSPPLASTANDAIVVDAASDRDTDTDTDNDNDNDNDAVNQGNNTVSGERGTVGSNSNKAERSKETVLAS